MIIIRSPYRISLGGGGTDLPSFYEQHEAFFISAAINRHIYITIHPTMEDHIILRLPERSCYPSVDLIDEPLTKHAMLDVLGVDIKGLEICSMAELPEKAGMGSSGSYLVCLLKALQVYLNKAPSGAEQLAEKAFEIEHNQLGLPVGKQDQYISALGGLRAFNISKDGTVRSRTLNLSQQDKAYFMQHLVFFYTGKQRASSEILQEQHDKSLSYESDIFQNLKHIKVLGLQACEALESQNFDDFGLLMNEHWHYKQQRSNKMSDPTLNQFYDYAMANGALGGKLIGAGGGGFFMFYCKDKMALLKAMQTYQMKGFSLEIDEEGVCAVR